MKNGVFFGLLMVLWSVNLRAQMNQDASDSKYLEDQIYLALSYDILVKLPTDISQNGFSGGFALGFIKDLPINTKRTIGFGLGLGYSYDVYIQNLKISRNSPNTLFETANSNYNVNKLMLSSIDVPFEFRLRNSTATKYKFFRVYTGIKLSYLLLSKSIYRDAVEKVTTKNIPEINKIRYGLNVAAGYGTWNIYFYYGLNPVFKNSFLNGNKINMKNFKIGLKFYIM